MVLDVRTTIQYYDYGVDPVSFQCNLTRNDLSMEQNTFTSTTEPSSTSPDFFYFNWACVVWALTPCWIVIQSIVILIACMFDVNFLPLMRDKVWNWIEGKFDNINRQPVLEWNGVLKVVLIMLSLPITILISILWAYVFSPFVIIVNGAAILCPRMDDISWVKLCKRQVKNIKVTEAIFEAIGQ